MLELRLLGPVEVHAGGRAVAAGSPQQSAVLAALAVDAGRSVPVEVLLDRVWGDTPPEKVRRTLHTYIARIRRLLKESDVDAEPVSVVHQGGGYALDVDPDRVDLHRFRHLLDSARKPDHPEQRRALLLGEALELWRGQPLAGIPGQWAARMRETWQHQRVDAVVAWAQAELQLDNAATVIGTLTDLVDEHPLVEPLTAMLMRALHAAGRNAQALDCYLTIRRRLVEELGADPDAELQQLHQAILRGDVKQPAAPVAMPVPAQLPMDVPGFTGRARELARLDALLSKVDQRPAVVVATLSGTAGVGKTALAVHWAHRVADRFPDGQLYVNLRGFEPAGTRTSLQDAIRGFLEAFEVPASRIPATLQGQIGLYRSLLSGQRVLVVLDNAHDADQVRPLLPGTSSCLAIVTSRNQLSGLIAAEGAHPISLDLLNPDECQNLLARRIGANQIAAEPEAVQNIIAACARLPLALAIVAARAALQPNSSLAVFAKELHDTHGSLDAFAGPDSAIDVRAAFSLSYQTLTPDAARLFRLLGIHPGPDISAPAAASLAGIPAAGMRPLLAELTRAHLVSEPSPGRYTFHDLLRAYATEQALAVDTDADRRAGLHRVLDHYLHTAHAADRLIDPHRDAVAPAGTQPGVAPEPLEGTRQALAWFAAERAVLRANIDKALDAGFHTHTWQLARSLANLFDRQGFWHDQAAVQYAALEAARRLADRQLQARAHRFVASAHVRLGHYHDGHTHFGYALDLYRELGDANGQAHAHLNLAWMLEQQGRYDDALLHCEQSLDLFQSLDQRAGLAVAINAMGWCHAKLADYQPALLHCQQALLLHQEVGNRQGEANTWHSLGYIHRRLGDYDQAMHCYQRALETYRAQGDRLDEAFTLGELGDALTAIGDHEAARVVWSQALGILDDLHHADADQIRTKLGTGPAQPAATIKPTTHLR